MIAKKVVCTVVVRKEDLTPQCFTCRDIARHATVSTGSGAS